MKKFSFVFTLALLIAMPSFANHVTPETAKKVASTFLNSKNVKTDQLINLSPKAEFHNLYIFTSDYGFVVLAADDCVQPILGYSTQGRFVAENIPENISDWLKDYDSQIQFAIDNKLSPSSQVAKQWKDLTEGIVSQAKATVIVEPLIQTTWNQNGTYDFDLNTYSIVFVDLYNNLCPYDEEAGKLTVTGCVATAMAQVMKYWNYPSHGIGSHSYIPETRPEFGEQFADFGSTMYDWDNMPDDLQPSSTETEKMAVATLMYHCGVAMDMDYNIADNGGSGASSYYMPDRLYNYFGYQLSTFESKSDYSETDWMNKLKNELLAERPVQYNGSGSGGHAFVCDGYDSDNYFHFNWGWGGQNDGYFSLSSLAPGSGGAGGGNYNFTNNQCAVFGIQPSTNNAEPSNLTYSLTGAREITLSWTGANGVSYNIYRNGTCIDNTDDTTYSETAPFGTNVYYIRSVNSANDLSLSSNSVTVTINYQLPVVNNLTATPSDNTASLSWTAPEWCYPETPTATLSYGDQNPTNSWSYVYYAHRYLAADLAQFANKAVYRIGTYVLYPGKYTAFIYTNTTSNVQPDASSLAAIKILNYSGSAGWVDIVLDEPIVLSGTNDLWVVMKQENTGQTYPTPCFQLSQHNINAFYGGSNSPTNLWDANSNYNFSWFIRADITDGIYTYNLYNDGVLIAENLSETNYSDVTLNDNAANLLTITTNYYGGEIASNMIGFAKGNASTASLELGENDRMTVMENATLTVTGSASNDDPERLVLENGAQLIHNSEGVKATVKKAINPYTETFGGWYFIATPLTEDLSPSNENGLLSNLYDLYYYDEPTYYWMNYKATPFDIVAEKGYLYANNTETNLLFAGTLRSSESAVVVDGLSHSSTVLNGFNLVGNPLACNANVDKDYYIIDDSGNEVVLAASDRTVKPCEGIMVKASANNEQVAFSKAPWGGKDICLDIVAYDNESELDRARLRFGQGENMEKFSLVGNRTQISFPKDDSNYAVAYVSLQDITPLNFKAAQEGVYTLKFSFINLELANFLLIDHFTETIVDLTEESSYTFRAQATDMEERFSLVFANTTGIDDNTPCEWFAYYADGRIVVPNMNSNETLQIIDITGRMVQNSNLSNGVYVLRLVSDNGVKTQKIVIK